MNIRFRVFSFILLFTSNLFSNEVFYTISICSTTTYKDAVFCKDNVLQKHEYDISIVKINDLKYRTNYGVFSSIEEARKVERNLENNIKKQKTFIIKIDKNRGDFESIEMFPKNISLESPKEIEKVVETSPVVETPKVVEVAKVIETPAVVEISKVSEVAKIVETPNIVEPPKIEKQKLEEFPKSQEKIAYLTFDDGPIIATKNILEAAQEEDVPVSMFFIGSQIENFRNIYENALSYPNVTIGNHTYSHANGRYKQFYSDADVVVQDIKKANTIISKDRISTTQSSFLPTRLAGRNVFRLPIFSRNDNGLPKEQVSKEWLGYEKIYGEGFYIYGWDLEWSYESTGKPILAPIDIVNKMELIHSKSYSRLPNKVVLLMHDRMFNNSFNGKENLQTLIKLLKNNGWKFENIERYF